MPIDPAGVTKSGTSLPVTTNSNVRSFIRSIDPSASSVYALIANLLATSLLTWNGTPCKLARACGTPTINPLAEHCIPGGSCPAITV